MSDILESDSGDYYCNANNPHGTAIEKNIKVIVNNPTSKGKIPRVSVQGVESLWGDCRFIPADWGS